MAMSVIPSTAAQNAARAAAQKAARRAALAANPSLVVTVEVLHRQAELARRAGNPRLARELLARARG